MSKTIISVVVAVIALGGYFLLKSPRYQEPNSGLTLQFVSQETSSKPKSSTNQTPAIQEEPIVEQNIVIYGETGFSPNILRVKVGETVVFKNEKSDFLWVASNPHPTHTDYSDFDARGKYAKSQSYSFTFTKPGVWKYHNHLNPSQGGSIIVE